MIPLTQRAENRHTVVFKYGTTCYKKNRTDVRLEQFLKKLRTFLIMIKSNQMHSNVVFKSAKDEFVKEKTPIDNKG